MRAIEVAPIPNRIGHYLVEDLIADLNGTGQTASPPKYRLVVTVSTRNADADSQFGDQRRVVGDVDRRCELLARSKVDGGAEVLKGNATAAAAYDRTTQRYADLRAARDAEIRVARALSSQISLRLASSARGEDLLRGKASERDCLGFAGRLSLP